MPKDYYATLGVSRNATQDEVKAAYKKLAKQHHPDLNKNNKDAEVKFKEINEAYRVIGDEKKRQHYDRSGADEQTQSQGGPSAGQGYEGFSGFGGGFDFNDIFGDFFGGDVFGGRNRGRGEDLRIALTLTLEEAAQGKKHSFSVDHLIHCSDCKGSGAEGGKRRKCTECNGQGRVRVTRRTPFGVMQTVGACEACNGTGTVAERVCHTCRGEGRIEKEDNITFDIPAGIADGMQLRLGGKGNAGLPGFPPGDLLVDVQVREHKLFTRDGDDLHIIAYITYPQAALGDNIEVPTLDSSIKLSIPEGTQSHTVLRVRGKGMPKLRGNTGDLLVTIKIDVPKRVSSKERELIEKLAGVEKSRSFFERFKF